MSNMDKYESFFRYTSGRWLYNEKEQLAIRYVRFNVDALKKVAAEAVGASYCTDIRKTHEGAFNKIFMLRFDNNAELVAKIPTPLVSPPHLCTASEVATMDYVRNVMGLPVPKVFGWCSRAETTDVGAEYILMEKIDGVVLSASWTKLKGQDAVDMMEQLISCEQSFSRHKFSQIGSLYYKEDVAPALQGRRLYADGVPDNEASDRFRIGPLAMWEVWCGRRVNITLDRGPWPDIMSFFSGIVRIQEEYLRFFARARPAPFDRPSEDASPSSYIPYFHRFLQVAPTLLPSMELQYPVLWHEDLHRSNIMMQPSGLPPVAAVLDWQTVSALPLILQAVSAAYIVYDGDPRIEIVPGNEKPRMPANYDELPPDEKRYLRIQQGLALRWKLYQSFMYQRCPSQWAALHHPYRPWLTSFMIELFASWFHGVSPLRQILVEIQSEWDSIAPGQPFPCPIDETELKRHETEYERTVLYKENVESLRADLGSGFDGEVSHNQYLQVKKLNEKMKFRWNEEEMGGPYPFQDGGYSYWLDF
ncbi:unnamed protein product [Somion occarium]|uniref:Altered inheritance of mitochondria protein 9, mitochondrial n=1 Tax=Somion occarium TaxID=3059160 RepID=A0ABP1CGM5_9APHY